MFTTNTQYMVSCNTCRVCSPPFYSESDAWHWAQCYGWTEEQLDWETFRLSHFCPAHSKRKESQHG